MSATTISEATTAAAVETIKKFTFGTTDYIVFVVMLLISASIGVYFGFFSKAKNTTDEYLMGGKRMKTIPIAISLVASQLSAISIMSVPAETYGFGFNYIAVVLAMVPTVPVLIYVVIPVFYENNLSNCYEYLQLRFNVKTRRFVTVTFILHAILTLPVLIFVPSLAFSQVTGININLINAVVSSICIFYTMLGGIKAVVWTDVVQAGIMLSSVILVGVLGTFRVGGLSQVLENASAGGRMDFTFGLDPRIRMTVWSGFITGFLMWTGHVGLNQSCVQRIVSLPSINHARKALFMAGIGFVVIMGFNSFIGIIMFARYYGCDPVQLGLVDKIDKLVPYFVQDVIGHLVGMPGVFISCVFSAALSTMSAVLNSLSGVVYFDYIRPYIKHTEAKANYIMRTFVVVMGIYCIAGGYIVQKFNSILQLVITISGINTGAVVGVFLLGMFVPRVNGKVAMISFLLSIVVMFWIIVNAQIAFARGDIKYSPIPTSIDQCPAESLLTIANATRATPVDIETPARRVTTAFESNRDFSIYDMSFYWYKIVGTALVWIIAIPLSYVWKKDKDEAEDPKLYSPFVRKFLKKRTPTKEEVPLNCKTPRPSEAIEVIAVNHSEKEKEAEGRS